MKGFNPDRQRRPGREDPAASSAAGAGREMGRKEDTDQKLKLVFPVPEYVAFVKDKWEPGTLHTAKPQRILVD